MPGEDRPLVQLATRISADLRRRAKLAAIANDMTLQDFVVEALEEHLAAARAAAGPSASGDDHRRAADDGGCWAVPPALVMTAR